MDRLYGKDFPRDKSLAKNFSFDDKMILFQWENRERVFFLIRKKTVFTQICLKLFEITSFIPVTSTLK